jgi:GTP pyrophosphokinase
VGHETVARLFDQERVEDFHAAVGFGDIHSPQIASKLAEVRPGQDEAATRGLTLPPATQASAEGIEVQGTGGLLTRLAQCCHPLPGDEITGYVTRGRGVTVHRRDCPNALRLNETGRLIEVSWGTRQQTVPTAIRILAYDRTGLLHEIAGIISGENINIDRSGVEPDHRKNITTIYITVEISDITQLSRVLTKIEQLPNVIEARRYTG